MDYRSEIQFWAKQHSVDAKLVEAIVLQESAGRADAFRYEPGFYDRYLRDNDQYRGQIPRRIASSYGLMQVMYTTAQMYGFHSEPEMLFLPNTNLDYGCRHVSTLLKRYDFVRAIQAYNAGVPDTGPGKTYARQVIARLKKLDGAAA